jgi:O-succinylbenzoate synthase
VEFVEQPVAAEARGVEDLLCGLAADFPTVIALDESIATDRHVERWLGLGWRGVFVIKPMLLSDPQTVLAALKKAKVPVVFSSALETAVGAASGLRLAFDFAAERRPLGYGVYPLFEDGRFNGPSAAPFLRRSDLNRGNAEALWVELA